MDSMVPQEAPGLFPLLSALDTSFPDPIFYSMQSGLMLCSTVNVAVQLDLASHLEAQPQTVEALAQATRTHAASLVLLLRALAGVGLFAEIDAETQTFAHTTRSRLLLPHVPGSMADLVKLWGAEYQWDSWRDLLYTIQTGKPAMQKHAGADANIWTYLNTHPQEMTIFQRGLVAVTNLIGP